MTNTSKKKRREGLPSTGRSMNAMNRRSNGAAASVLAESAQAARNKRNVAVTSKNHGISERGMGDAYRSSLSRKRVQSSSSQLPSPRPFLPPRSDKVVEIISCIALRNP